MLKRHAKGYSSRFSVARALEGFEFIECAGPVGFQEAGEASICQDFSAGLAFRAVVGFVVGVADALDFFSTR
jgi:hypothetical protein